MIGLITRVTIQYQLRICYLKKIYSCRQVTAYITMDIKISSSNNTGVQKFPSTRHGRQIDLAGAASGYGGGYCCDTGVDLPTLLALLAGN